MLTPGATRYCSAALCPDLSDTIGAGIKIMIVISKQLGLNYVLLSRVNL